jgi:hypothetical protein
VLVEASDHHFHGIVRGGDERALDGIDQVREFHSLGDPENVV